MISTLISSLSREQIIRRTKCPLWVTHCGVTHNGASLSLAAHRWAHFSALGFRVATWLEPIKQPMVAVYFDWS